MLIQRLAPTMCDIRGFRAKLCAALVVIAGAAPGALGAQTPVTVNPAVEVNPASEIRASRPNIRLGWSISNNSPDPIQVTVIARGTFRESATRCEAADGCTLNWRLGAEPLVPDQRKEFPLPAYETRDLVYEGRGEALGPYQSGALVVWRRAADQSTTTVPVNVRIRRGLPELGAGAVVVGPIGTLTRCPCGEANDVPVTITNGLPEAVTLSGAPRARLLSDDGSSTYNHLVREEALVCPGSSAAGSGPTIAPGRPLSCTLRITVGPGRYRATVSLPGASLGATGNATDFSVRYPWPYAWIILFIGGLGGAWLAAYQGNARRRAFQLADALDYSASAREMHDDADPAKQRGTRKILEEILDDLAAKMLLLRTNATADFDLELKALKARLPAIQDFGGLEKRYFTLDASLRPKQAYDAARSAVAAATLPADYAEKLGTLRAAIEAVEPDPGTIAALSAAEPGPGDLFPIDLESRSSKQLREWVRRNDRYIAFATVLLVATIGVATLWKSSPTWGSIGDILIALMTGIGATITGTLTIRQLVSGYPLPTIPPAR